MTTEAPDWLLISFVVVAFSYLAAMFITIYTAERRVDKSKAKLIQTIQDSEDRRP